MLQDRAVRDEKVKIEQNQSVSLTRKVLLDLLDVRNRNKKAERDARDSQL